MDLTDTELLHLLRLYLENLPERHLPYCSLAESNYRFHVFAIDPEWEEDIGMEGAANRELEVRLGSRAKGPIVLTECGPGLSSVVDVLAKYLTKFPSSAILKKWVSDLIESAKGAYEEANVPLPTRSPSPEPGADALVAPAPTQDATSSQFTLGGLHGAIDLDTCYLRDLLEDSATASEPIATVLTDQSKTTSANSSQALLVVPEASEWDSWDP
ncbi:hypothetical protein L210DRAFT_3652517 [Boletus edulis BED1]|uniref:Uncharacterized protein n=1 Tax=Boletus edulis BED1 TaxID=1328754 RepID=A0AAD4G7S2_BOLED|nr:hypothetical protein L210DRAFT_3652517 [Boletus edulis BED1]